MAKKRRYVYASTQDLEYLEFENMQYNASFGVSRNVICQYVTTEIYIFFI